MIYRSAIFSSNYRFVNTTHCTNEMYLGRDLPLPISVCSLPFPAMYSSSFIALFLYISEIPSFKFFEENYSPPQETSFDEYSQLMETSFSEPIPQFVDTASFNENTESSIDSNSVFLYVLNDSSNLKTLKNVDCFERY